MYIKNILLIYITFSFLFLNCKNSFKSEDFNDTVKKVSNDSITHQNSKHDSISIIAVGDIMMGSNYPSNSSLPPDDGKFLFKDVKDILQNADLTMGNLEGTFLNKGGTPKICKDSSGHCVSFRMPEYYAGYLKEAGFDYMNLANNHSGDMGELGRERTVQTLEDFDIKFAGSLEYPTAIIEKDGIKFGFSGFAPNRGAVSILNLNNAKEIISSLKKEVDIVIVFFHGGAEGISAQHIKYGNEIFLGENRGNVIEFAHSVIDAGADLVFGSGPHVIRAVELYQGKFIAYSLGNFCTYGKFGLDGALGYAPIIKVFINKKGDFLKAEVTSIKQIKHGFPVMDENNSAFKFLSSLTKSDFQNSGLDFRDYNIIKK